MVIALMIFSGWVKSWILPNPMQTMLYPINTYTFMIKFNLQITIKWPSTRTNNKKGTLMGDLVSWYFSLKYQ